MDFCGPGFRFPATPPKGRTMPKFIKIVPVEARPNKSLQPYVIQTLEGEMTAMPGDWIATGPKGEEWPIGREIFFETYRPQPGDTQAHKVFCQEYGTNWLAKGDYRE
jgi:hypothetical protein